MKFHLLTSFCSAWFLTGHRLVPVCDPGVGDPCSRQFFCGFLCQPLSSPSPESKWSLPFSPWTSTPPTLPPLVNNRQPHILLHWKSGNTRQEPFPSPHVEIRYPPHLGFFLPGSVEDVSFLLPTQLSSSSSHGSHSSKHTLFFSLISPICPTSPSLLTPSLQQLN